MEPPDDYALAVRIELAEVPDDPQRAAELRAQLDGGWEKGRKGEEVKGRSPFLPFPPSPPFPS